MQATVPVRTDETNFEDLHDELISDIIVLASPTHTKNALIKRLYEYAKISKRLSKAIITHYMCGKLMSATFTRLPEHSLLTPSQLFIKYFKHTDVYFTPTDFSAKTNKSRAKIYFENTAKTITRDIAGYANLPPHRSKLYVNDELITDPATVVDWPYSICILLNNQTYNIYLLTESNSK